MLTEHSSCAGVTPTTITLPPASITTNSTKTVSAPVQTITSYTKISTTLQTQSTLTTLLSATTPSAQTFTVTIPAIATVSPVAYCPFKLKNNAPDSRLDGFYAVVKPNYSVGQGNNYIAPGTVSEASIFNCDAATHLLDGNLYANFLGGYSNGVFDFDTLATLSGSGLSLATCPVGANGILQYSTNGASTFQFCNYGSLGDYGILSTALDGSSCDYAYLQVVPISC